MACSAGSACHTAQLELSPVLEAMNVPSEYALGTLRLSIGRDTTSTDIDRALSSIYQVVCKLQNLINS